MKLRMARIAALLAAASVTAVACGGFVTTPAPTDASIADGAPGPDAVSPADAAKDQSAPDASADSSTDAATDQSAPDAADSSTPDTSTDASTDAADGGACVSGPRAGAACAPTDVPCANVDLCCSGGAKWKCEGGRWVSYPSGILCIFCQSTACGTTPCPGNQLCVERTSGIPGGQSSFSCQDYPSTCSDDWSCGCVVPTVPGCSAARCVETPARHVRVTCQGI